MAYIKKINGYLVKDEEARQAAADAATAAGNAAAAAEAARALAAGKQDPITFDGTYSASSNKAATVKTVTDKIAEVVASAPDNFDTLKEIADWISNDTTGAASMANRLSSAEQAIENIEDGTTVVPEAAKVSGQMRIKLVNPENGQETQINYNGSNTSPYTAGSEENPVANAWHANSAEYATNAGDANYATSAGSATKATQDGSGRNIANTYATKSELAEIAVSITVENEEMTIA